MKWKAVLVGLVVDTVGSFICGIGLVLLSWFISLSRVHSTRLQFSDADGQKALFLWISMLIGLLLTGIGGFVAAKLAKSAEFRNAAAMAILALVLSVPFSFSLPVWYNSISFAMIIPS